MAAIKNKATPKYVIDTYGLRSALTSKQKGLKNAVINSIQNGEMLILKSVSKELKENDPEVYEDMQCISPKKYLAVDVATSKAAAVLVDSHGGSRLFGLTPPIDRFRALAAARIKKLILITDGKALKDCQGIVHKCKLPAGCVAAPATV